MTGREQGVQVEAAMLAGDVVKISALIDANYPADLDPEAHLFRRVIKVQEEGGEVAEALLGVLGENPRKGVTHTRVDLRRELLDVALAALGAVAHIDGNDTAPGANPVSLLATHARYVRLRLVVALAERSTS